MYRKWCIVWDMPVEICSYMIDYKSDAFGEFILNDWLYEWCLIKEHSFSDKRDTHTVHFVLSLKQFLWIQHCCYVTDLICDMKWEVYVFSMYGVHVNDWIFDHFLWLME